MELILKHAVISYPIDIEESFFKIDYPDIADSNITTKEFDKLIHRSKIDACFLNQLDIWIKVCYNSNDMDICWDEIQHVIAENKEYAEESEGEHIELFKLIKHEDKITGYLNSPFVMEEESNVIFEIRKNVSFPYKDCALYFCCNLLWRRGIMTTNWERECIEENAHQRKNLRLVIDYLFTDDIELELMKRFGYKADYRERLCNTIYEVLLTKIESSSLEDDLFKK